MDYCELVGIVIWVGNWLICDAFYTSVEEHARFVILFVLLCVWIITVYLLKLFCSATVPLCYTIVLSWARHIRLTSIDASKWYWDVNSQYRIMTFPKCSAPVCSCIILTVRRYCKFIEAKQTNKNYCKLWAHLHEVMIKIYKTSKKYSSSDTVPFNNSMSFPVSPRADLRNINS